MKRFIIIMFVLLLLFSTGCTKSSRISQNESEMPNVDNSNISTNNSTSDAPDYNLDTKQQFDENTPLFICQDRADIEDDRLTVYYYNYKGDPIQTNNAGTIGMHSKNGLAPAYDPATEKVGFVDKSGVFVIEPQWDEAASFSDNGIALVRSYSEESKRSQFSYINSQGDLIFPHTYDIATSFYPKGLAIIGIADEAEDCIKFGVIDEKGTLIIETKYIFIDHIVGDYIYCSTEDEHIIYDLCGNKLFSDTSDNNADEYFFHDGFLYRDNHEEWNQDEKIILKAVWLKEMFMVPRSYIFSYIKPEIFDGTDFIPSYNDQKPQIRIERVATTSTGYGCGIQLNQETVIPYEYNRIIPYGDFYVAIKYIDGNENNQTIDIFNEKFQKTAEDLPYNFNWQRVDSIGQNMILPSGYFDVYVYDEDVDIPLHGIIDFTGKIIVPLLYHRGISLYTYEGLGGMFDHLV